jgi:hypothetical protein
MYILSTYTTKCRPRPPIKGNEMTEKSKRINQLKITIIDNLPNMLDNHWFDPGFDTKYTKNEYKGRYKLNLWMLTPTRPVKLQSTLSWPPSDLARRQRWKDHKNFYEQQRNLAIELNGNINRNSPIPTMLGLPSESQSMTSKKTGKNIHKWYLPKLPSLMQVQLLRKEDSSKYWLIHWIMPTETLEFVIDQDDCKVEMWDNKDGGQSRVYMKTYAHAFNIDPDYYMPTHQEQFIQEDIDYEYEEFKKRVNHLYAMNADAEARAVMNQYSVYSERWLKELG